LAAAGECATLGGLFQGVGSLCLGDADGNGFDDACEYAVRFYSVDGGSGRLSVTGVAVATNRQAGLELRVTVGQPDVGVASGDGYVFRGGFWASRLAPRGNIPALTAWGVLVLGLAVVTAGSLVLRRRLEMKRCVETLH
jgi:hypothetical protein